MRVLPRKRALGAYVAAVTAAGVVGIALSGGSLGATQLQVWELACFVGLAVALDLMVIPLAGGGAAAASFAAYLAGLLVLGSGVTAWVAALSIICSEGVIRRRPLAKVGFNAGHSVLSLLAAGVVYRQAGGSVGDLHMSHLPELAAVGAAVLCLWLLETTWVSLAVTLERGGRAWRRLLSSLGPMLALDGALASMGLLLALLYLHLGRDRFTAGNGTLSVEEIVFFLAVAIIPAMLLYYAYRLQGEVRGAYRQSLQSLGWLMEAKLEDSQPGHGERVATLAAGMANALEMPEDEIEQIEFAGYLHDIGKVGVPASLLSRRRDMFSGEPEQVRMHPVIGAQILAPIQFLRPAAEIVRAHHERWDGLGYPARLRADQIPLGARILALANAYLGMTRSHMQAPLAPEQAVSRIRQGAGSRFDPALVEVLARVLQETGEVSTYGALAAPRGHAWPVPALGGGDG